MVNVDINQVNNITGRPYFHLVMVTEIHTMVNVDIMQVNNVDIAEWLMFI